MERVELRTEKSNVIRKIVIVVGGRSIDVTVSGGRIHPCISSRWGNIGLLLGLRWHSGEQGAVLWYLGCRPVERQIVPMNALVSQEQQVRTKVDET